MARNRPMKLIWRLKNYLAVGLLCALASACDSNGSGGGTPSATPQALTSMEQSARFLGQATLGASMEEVVYVEGVGFESWIAEQLAIPASSHLEALERLQADYGDPAIDGTFSSPFFRRYAWWDRVMGAPDVLRQRVAMALSEIFVISELVDFLFIHPESVASYYDLLLDNAFGSYEELLLAVTLHPAMGVYLSHLNNDRSNEVLGRFPDENYAREVMQLFSIGLFELAPDGSFLRDASGDPVPTYDNADITEFAKIFTGLGLQGPGASFGDYPGNRTLPMVIYEPHHEPGPKTLLQGFPIPAGQSGMQDIEETIGHLADHPNVGPFLSTRLIQRLVKSNPSPEYIARISAVFDDDGAGERGNLAAVVRAILLDAEARRDPVDDNDGRLREPFLRWVTLLRTFNAASPSGEYLIEASGVGLEVQQHPMASPSVFNFFQPDFAPTGPIKSAGLLAPEFQITTDTSVVAIANFSTFFTLFEDAAIPAPIEFFRAGSIDASDIPVSLNLTDEAALVGDVDALLDRLDLLLTYGNLSDQTRNTIREAVEGVDPSIRVFMALHLILISPDFAIVN